MHDYTAKRNNTMTELFIYMFLCVSPLLLQIGSLIIPFVRKMDSGNYTCQPSNSASVSVHLHVLSGKCKTASFCKKHRAQQTLLQK